MIDWTSSDKKVLETHTRPIVHMRRQFQTGRFGLVFGSGLNHPLGMPGWSKLNELIADDPKVNGRSLLKSTEDHTIITQRLFEHFKSKQYLSIEPENSNDPGINSDVHREWRNILRDKLYSTPQDSAISILQKHTYLKHYIEIIRNNPLTVTYNFDDVIEKALVENRTNHDKKISRGYVPTANLRVPLRRNSCVIYHPNGYIPRNVMEGGFEDIVLLEDEFANRMMETLSGQYASLLHHLTTNTCLFIGLSLKDTILKNLLRQSAIATPAHYHYYVHHCKNGLRPTIEEQSSIRAANFKTYNLITLFLCDEEIASLGKLISVGCNPIIQKNDDHAITHLADEVGVSLLYCFYVVGPVGAGKSTIISHFRDLVMHDEWFEDRLPELAEDYRDLKDNKKRIDKWIARQFKMKNYLLDGESLGIVICDRCPLDPISFTPKEEWRMKADFLLKTICPGKAKTGIKLGHIIMITNDPVTLEIRIRRTHKKYRKQGLKKMQEVLSYVYNMDGVTVVDAKYMTFGELIKRIGTIIHFEDYESADIQKRMEEIRDGKYA